METENTLLVPNTVKERSLESLIEAFKADDVVRAQDHALWREFNRPQRNGQNIFQMCADVGAHRCLVQALRGHSLDTPSMLLHPVIIALKANDTIAAHLLYFSLFTRADEKQKVKHQMAHLGLIDPFETPLAHHEGRAILHTSALAMLKLLSTETEVCLYDITLIRLYIQQARQLYPNKTNSQAYINFFTVAAMHWGADQVIAELLEMGHVTPAINNSAPQAPEYDWGQFSRDQAPFYEKHFKQLPSIFTYTPETQLPYLKQCLMDNDFDTLNAAHLILQLTSDFQLRDLIRALSVHDLGPLCTLISALTRHALIYATTDDWILAFSQLSDTARQHSCFAECTLEQIEHLVRRCVEKDNTRLLVSLIEYIQLDSTIDFDALIQRITPQLNADGKTFLQDFLLERHDIMLEPADAIVNTEAAFGYFEPLGMVILNRIQAMVSNDAKASAMLMSVNRHFRHLFLRCLPEYQLQQLNTVINLAEQFLVHDVNLYFSRTHWLHTRFEVVLNGRREIKQADVSQYESGFLKKNLVFLIRDKPLQILQAERRQVNNRFLRSSIMALEVTKHIFSNIIHQTPHLSNVKLGRFPEICRHLTEANIPYDENSTLPALIESLHTLVGELKTQPSVHTSKTEMCHTVEGPVSEARRPPLMQSHHTLLFSKSRQPYDAQASQVERVEAANASLPSTYSDDETMGLLNNM